MVTQAKTINNETARLEVAIGDILTLRVGKRRFIRIIIADSAEIKLMVN